METQLETFASIPPSLHPSELAAIIVGSVAVNVFGIEHLRESSKTPMEEFSRKRRSSNRVRAPSNLRKKTLKRFPAMTLGEMDSWELEEESEHGRFSPTHIF